MTACDHRNCSYFYSYYDTDRRKVKCCAAFHSLYETGEDCTLCPSYSRAGENSVFSSRTVRSMKDLRVPKTLGALVLESGDFLFLYYHSTAVHSKSRSHLTIEIGLWDLCFNDQVTRALKLIKEGLSARYQPKSIRVKFLGSGASLLRDGVSNLKYYRADIIISRSQRLLNRRGALRKSSRTKSLV